MNRAKNSRVSLVWIHPAFHESREAFDKNVEGLVLDPGPFSVKTSKTRPRTPCRRFDPEAETAASRTGTPIQ